jgi:hypothetical protein
MSKQTIASAVILVALAVGYMAWLDSGCEVVGVMTWHGKVCAEDIR